MDYQAISTELDGVHYCFIIDILLKPESDFEIYMQCLDTILAFANAMLLQSGGNKLTILGSSLVSSAVLFMNEVDLPLKKTQFNGQQMENFAQVTTAFRLNLIKWLQQCVQQCKDTAEQQSSKLADTMARGLCVLNRFKADYRTSRLLVFSLGSEQVDSYSSQYMKLINCFFAAQKTDVMLDACSTPLSRESEDSAPVSASMEDRFAASILQQGADLTGGRYIRVHKVSTLLQHLFWCFYPSAADRAKLVLPPKLKISPPAACFCHRKVLDVGYVCSVCVSIFCKYTPYCSTCNSNVFVRDLKAIASLKATQKETI